MLVTEYVVKFLQLSRFGMYLILNEEKKAKKFERALTSRVWIMMSCFNIRDSSQLVDRASIYEESLKKNTTECVDQKRKAQRPGTSAGRAESAKRMVVGSFPPQRSQGRISSNPQVSL